MTATVDAAARIDSEGTAGQSSPAAFWAGSERALLRTLDSGYEGLTAGESQRRLRRAGVRASHHYRTPLVLLLRQFANPITLILVTATVIAAILTTLAGSPARAWGNHGGLRAGHGACEVSFLPSRNVIQRAHVHLLDQRAQ